MLKLFHSKYNRQMGNSTSHISQVARTPVMKNCFLIDRLIAAECDFLPAAAEQVIRVGVFTSSEDTLNPLNKQGIRIGDGDILTMKQCVEYKDALECRFEQNVILNVFRRDDSVVYRLQTPTIDVTRTINPVVVKHFKTIGMRDASMELDKLGEIMR